jgi:hypothetical protein
MNQIETIMALADSFAEYRDHSEYVHARDKLRQALEAALKPGGEPACYQYQSRDGQWQPFMNEKHYADTVADGSWPIRALYTAAPPRREPLSDEQIRDLWSWSASAEAECTATTQQHAFARAVETAHGIGGKE